MEKIGNILKLPKPKRAPSERAELIGYITDTLNSERRGTKYPKLTYKRIGIQCAHLSKADLYYIKSMFKDCQNRGYPCGKWFFWAMKEQPNDAQRDVGDKASGLQVALSNRRGASEASPDTQ